MASFHVMTVLALVDRGVSFFKHQRYIKTLSHFPFNIERNPETRSGTEKIQKEQRPSFAC
jgi:hypothetical protein